MTTNAFYVDVFFFFFFLFSLNDSRTNLFNTLRVFFSSFYFFSFLLYLLFIFFFFFLVFRFVFRFVVCFPTAYRPVRRSLIDARDSNAAKTIAFTFNQAELESFHLPSFLRDPRRSFLSVEVQPNTYLNN